MDAPFPRFAMVAGESSGDLLAGLLLDGLRQRWSGLSACGIGGPHMVRRGFEPWWPHDKLSVHGYGLDVFLRVGELLAIRSRLKTRLLQRKPDLFIGVDAPDFNLALEAGLRSRGVKTVHFVCPSIWAWRAERVEKIRRSADHVLCLFPFEPALLATHGVAATFVGHPLASVIPMAIDRAQARHHLGLAASDLVVAVLPGSRRSEIEHLATRFVQAAAILKRARPTIKFVIPAIASLRERIEQVLRDAGMAEQVLVVQGQSHTVLAACDLTLIASGTATLEAALFKRPMVIAYNMSWMSWRLMRSKQLQPWVGLPNILCGEFVVPELLQDAATPQALAHEALLWIEAIESRSARIETLERRFAELHLSLQGDTSQLAAHAIEQVLEG
jgi:lipid-A-disaccharide synthase